MQLIRKPGTGWKYLGSSVWGHESGVRVHCLGFARMPDGAMHRSDGDRLAEGYIRLSGGNRKRGLMMWALSLHRIQETVKRLCELTGVPGDCK